MNKPASELIALADELREYTALRYAGDCKCGQCQLVPREIIIKTMDALRLASVRDRLTELLATVPLPPVNDGAVREALDDMLGAFAEGVCWNPEQRAAYEKAETVFSGSDKESDDERLERLAREDSHRDGQIEEYKPDPSEAALGREDKIGAAQSSDGGQEEADEARRGMAALPLPADADPKHWPSREDPVQVDRLALSEPKSQEPDAVAVGYCCDGCGRLMQNADEDMKKLRVAGFLSCCPERRLRPVYTTKPEAQAVSVDAIKAAIPRVTDNDRDEITVTLDGKELRGWLYLSDSERRTKMLCARDFVEGFCSGRQS